MFSEEYLIEHQLPQRFIVQINSETNKVKYNFKPADGVSFVKCGNVLYKDFSKITIDDFGNLYYNTCECKGEDTHYDFPCKYCGIEYIGKIYDKDTVPNYFPHDAYIFNTPIGIKRVPSQWLILVEHEGTQQIFIHKLFFDSIKFMYDFAQHPNPIIENMETDFFHVGEYSKDFLQSTAHENIFTSELYDFSSLNIQYDDGYHIMTINTCSCGELVCDIEGNVLLDNSNFENQTYHIITTRDKLDSFKVQ